MVQRIMSFRFSVISYVYRALVRKMHPAGPVSFPKLAFLDISSMSFTQTLSFLSKWVAPQMGGINEKDRRNA